MFYFYTVSEKIYVEKDFPKMTNPLTNGEGVEFVVYQRYASMLLPFMPMSLKKVDVYTSGTDQLLDKKQWTPEIKEKAKELKSQAKGTWKLFSFWYVFLTIILIAFIYTHTEMYFKKQAETEFVSYLDSPQVGDIIIAKVFPSNSNQASDVIAYPFKIVGIVNDTLKVVLGDQNAKSDYDVARMMKKFDINTIQFNTEDQCFNLQYYKNRHLLPFVKKDTDPNLIEIVNVLR